MRVLVIDDDAALREIFVRRGMELGHDVDEAPTIGRAEALLAAGSAYDILVVDGLLPDGSGIDLISKLPILLIGRTQTAEERIAAFEAGADDCLQRPMLLDEIVVRLSRHLDRARRVRASAERDPMTGLLTRTSFSSIASRQWRRLQREQMPMSLAALAVDDRATIASELGSRMLDMADAGLVELVISRFRPGDLRGSWNQKLLVRGGAVVRSLSDAAEEGGGFSRGTRVPRRVW